MSEMARNRFSVLSIDGGGIRGVIPARWLVRIEEALGGPVRERFDLVAGTSTGAILACGLAAGMPAAELAERYDALGRMVFPAACARLRSRIARIPRQGLSAPKYDERGLARALSDTFGDLRFGELGAATLVTAYDVEERRPVVMKTAGAGHAGEPWRWDGVPVRDVVHASSAAPTYFPAHAVPFGGASHALIDGGVVANNPAACALAEAVRMNRERPPERRASWDEFVVVSLGTGSASRPIPARDAAEWGALQWAVPLLDVLFDGAADAVEYVVNHLAPDGRHVRYQVRLDPDHAAMDDADPTNLETLKSRADQWLATAPGQSTLQATLALLTAPRW